MNIVHVIGTGTIGEPLIRMLLETKGILGFDKVTFSKRSALLTDRSKVQQLITSGAELYSDTPDEFEEIGITCVGSTNKAIMQATVVIDCTPNGVALRHKNKIYLDLEKDGVGPSLYIAQGSENGFGTKYAFGISDADSGLTELPEYNEDKFLQVVSCNTHSLGAITKSIAGGSDNTASADFVCVRRANDVSQSSSFSPGVNVGADSGEFGTHHAEDLSALLSLRDGGYEDCDFYSSAMKVPTQYMHSVRFKIELEQPTCKEAVVERLESSKAIALTHKRDSNEIFSFGRDHGLFGRIFSHCVINPDTVNVSRNGRTVSGFAFTPQDGNSLLSSIAAATSAINPLMYRELVLKAFGKYLFSEV